MIGTIVNCIAVILGSVIGMILKKGLPDKLSNTVMKGLGLCTLYIGITGALEGDSAILLILAIVIGAIIGEVIDLDRRVNNLGDGIQGRLEKYNIHGKISEGFVTASLLFCVGAMTIVGALESGLTGKCDMLYTKSILDCVAAVIFASQYGFGVTLAAGFVLIYQGGITLLAQWIAPYLTDYSIAEMTCVGSVIIIGLAFNMLGITKLKVMNYVPAIFVAIPLALLMK